LAPFSEKAQKENISGFPGHMGSVINAQLSHHNAKAAIEVKEVA
jgi:hypothetical protein